MYELMAALRDATFYARPSGYGHNPRAPKYHAIVTRKDGTRGPACGIPFHLDDCEEPAIGTIPSERCGRPGCRKAFSTIKAKT